MRTTTKQNVDDILARKAALEAELAKLSQSVKDVAQSELAPLEEEIKEREERIKADREALKSLREKRDALKASFKEKGALPYERFGIRKTPSGGTAAKPLPEKAA